MNAIVFPGQGSQKIGMGAQLLESASGRAIFETSNEILGYDLAEICLNGPEEKLTNTLYAQPALLAAGVAAWEKARADGTQAQMTAGHSLGEYAALVAARALEFADAMRLVKRRAELMANAPAGTMAAIIGLPDELLDRVLEVANESGIVVAANFNSSGQIVVSGEESGVLAAMNEAKEQGAKKVVQLAVSGAFHSPLMREAGEEMRELIASAPFQNAQFPVYSNTTARAATDANALRAALSEQMTSAVRWTESIQNMVADGATEFYELGSGRVLAGLIKRIDKNVPTQSSES